MYLKWKNYLNKLIKTNPGSERLLVAGNWELGIRDWGLGGAIA
jgi:hypothetical protein